MVINPNPEINQAVAYALINQDEYAFWEREYGGHAGGIAKALGQPMWLVEAFQHTYRTRLGLLGASS
ncbi:hypothetical protein F4555_000947 [Mobiluncus mulieris]|uniref:hypothetical protein n=1 Tax=Mobiluncus mulieris TaxID=2052 RepID=UPI000E1B6A11|nr:hypothetical protein [Mobiluncus mulieris]MBB5846151.1 hypothetical protein [Mobiluncus mulieris]